MNIGVDARVLSEEKRTGVGEYAYEFLRALVSRDEKNQYFLFANGWRIVGDGLSFFLNRKNVHLVFSGWPNKIFNLSEIFFGRPRLDLTVADRSKKNKINLWFSPHLHFTGLSKQVVSALMVHDLSFVWRPEFFSWKRRLWHAVLSAKRQCERANIIFVPSENTKRDLVNFFHLSPEKIKVLYPGARADLEKPDEQSRKNIKAKYRLPEKFIFFLGTLEPRKNIKGLLEAYKMSGLWEKKYGLVIAGGRGWKDDDIVRAISLCPGAKHIGYVPDQEKAGLYSLAEIFVYPSFYEGFGLPVLEAMSAGIPVVTSNVSSLPEVSGDAAWLVDPNNKIELSRALNLLANNQKLRQMLSEKGKKRATFFDWRKTADCFLETIESPRR